MKLRARRIGRVAVSSLGAGDGLCIARFEHSAYLRLDHAIVWLVRPGLPMGPISVEVQTLPEKDTRCGIDPEGASIWHPLAHVPTPRASDGSPRAGGGCVDIAPLIERLGRGQGLTPEGDDYVIGYLLMANALGLHLDRELLLAEALKRTHEISVAHIRPALDGMGLDAFDQALPLIAAGTASHPVIARAMAIGGSSGRATVDGMRACFGIMSVLPEGLASIEWPALVESKVFAPHAAQFQ